MNEAVLRRFIIIVAIVTLAGVTLSAGIQEFLAPAMGDYETRKGDQLLTEGEFEEAIVWFERALAISPDHRGALMGRAIAYQQSGRADEAEVAFGHLIQMLQQTLAADDRTGRAVLAGAFANRGILRDRSGRHIEALADYRQALAIDAGAVDGPGLFHRILYGNTRPATVEKRARYLEQQLALPEAERRLSDPEADARQRMHKP
jgi:tetratricopeptide (TPR) repeat protein